MGVGAQGDDLAAEFPVAADDFPAGIGSSESVSEAAGVDFQADVLFDQSPENFVQKFFVFSVRIVAVLVWPVAHHIVQVAENVEIGVCFQVLQGALEVFQVGFLFPAAFIERRVVGVPLVYQVNRTDDKVKGMGEDQIVVLLAQIGL